MLLVVHVNEDARCHENVGCKDEGRNGIKADRERSADRKTAWLGVHLAHRAT